MSLSVTGDPLWMRRFAPATVAAPRLVVLPHAGGSAPFYRPLATLLAPSLDVLVAQYPGRQDRWREPPLEDLDAVADRLRAALPAGDGPLALYGHSMGAVLAFEVALRLEADGIGPTAVIVSGRRAPSVHREGTVHLRDDAGLLDELRALQVTDETLLADAELVRMILPAVRADYTAVERHPPRPGSVLSAPILTLTGDADPWTSVADAQAWQHHTSGRFQLEVLPGSHFFIVEHLPRLAALISTFTGG